jgi:hypothetical protein
MNWRNVLRLINVDVKAGRLVRGRTFRNYREKPVIQYLLYGGACVLGLAIGIGVGIFYSGIVDLELKALLFQSASLLLLSFPTLVLVFNLVLTMMGQIQRMGVSLSLQPPFWLPITWSEHTLASTLATLLGIPLAFVLFSSLAIFTASIFLGLVPLAILTIFALLGSALLASISTEIFRVLQMRLTGAVYKSSGKAAVWIRFLGTMLFLVVFYVIWLSFTSGTGSIALIEAVAGSQQSIWFVPYLWPAMSLVSFVSGLYLQTAVFGFVSLLFILALFYLAVRLNTRFGLYEPPAIRVSGGAYAPKVGLLGKLGFSSLESAILRKDFRAVTRRRELMVIFIMPLVVILIPLMQYLGLFGGSPPPEASSFLFVLIFLGPSAIMTVMLGFMIIGAEGAAVWHLYSSPISAKSLVKCKYGFMIIMSSAVVLICGIIGILLFQPSPAVTVALLIESILLIFALGAVSLNAGLIGADFTEIPRPRMVRPLTVLSYGALCLIFVAAIFFPLLLTEIVFKSIPFPLPFPTIDLYLAVAISAAIAITVTFVFYTIALRRAKQFLIKAEI